MTTLQVNGKEKTISDNATVAQMLRQLEVKNPLVIVEVNGNVVPKDQYPQATLQPGDAVEIIALMGGG